MESPVGQIRVCGRKLLVLLRRPDKILFYEFIEDGFELKQLFEFFDLPVISLDICPTGEIFALLLEKEIPKILRYTNSTSTMLNVLQDHTVEFEDSLEHLYKKRIDNISMYHERKRRRIEEEKAKCKV